MPHAHTPDMNTSPPTTKNQKSNKYLKTNIFPQTKPKKHESLTNTVVTAIQGLISAADEQLLKIDRIKQSAANNLSKVRTLYLHFLLANFSSLFLC